MNGNNFAPKPPISSETLLDIVQALGASSSEINGQREFGQVVLKQFFEEFPRKYEDDHCARAYIKEILAVVAAAVRGFAVERASFRTNRHHHTKIDELCAKILEPRFFVPFQGEFAKLVFSLFIKLVPISVLGGVLIGAGIKFKHWVIALGAIGGFFWILFGDFLVTYIMVRLQPWAYKRINSSTKELHDLWKKSFPRYKAVAIDLLINAERVRARYYPGSTGLLNGVCWNEVAAGDVATFISTPHLALAGKTPAMALSDIVDMHFSLDTEVPSRYVSLSSRAKSNAVASEQQGSTVLSQPSEAAETNTLSNNPRPQPKTNQSVAA